MKSDTEMKENKRKSGDAEGAPPAKKMLTEKKKSKKAVKEAPGKKLAKNTFKVIDVMEETDFVTLSRSQVIVEKPDKKKKKKNKSGKNKPAINLEALSGLVTKVAEVAPISIEEKEVEKSDEKENIPKKKKKTKKKQKAEDSEAAPESETIKPVTESSTKMSEWKEMFVCTEIIQALEEKGFHQPTPIQRMTLPASLKGKMDLVGVVATSYIHLL